MKKLSSLIAAALLLAACGASEDPANQYRDAMPKAGAVQVGTPQTEGTANALSVATGALGDSSATQSEYAIMSRNLALTFNGGVGLTLRLVQYITTFRPTSCDDASCTWGPWVDDDGLNRWKLTVQKVADGEYDYVLAEQPGSNPAAPWVSIIAGTAYPVDRDHGSGTFTIDFEAQTALDHGPLWQQHDFGHLDVVYDNTHDVSIAATFLDAKNSDPADPHRLNAAYSFEHAASGGTLQIAFENLDTTEVVSLRTRWSPGGAGRSDAHYDGPDGGSGRVSYYASECWAGAAQDYAEVYDSKHTEIPALSDPNACSPYMSADYADVVLPE